MDREAEEIICDLQAQVYVLRVALHALLRTHPEPTALLGAWRDSINVATAGPVVPAYARHSDYLAERCQAFSEDWTAELIELAIPASKT